MPTPTTGLPLAFTFNDNVKIKTQKPAATEQDKSTTTKPSKITVTGTYDAPDSIEGGPSENYKYEFPSGAPSVLIAGGVTFTFDDASVYVQPAKNGDQDSGKGLTKAFTASYIAPETTSASEYPFDPLQFEMAMVVEESQPTTTAGTSSPTTTNQEPAPDPKDKDDGDDKDPQGDDDSGLPGGAVAGVGVGCLFAGIIIGLLLAWLFKRYRRRSGSRMASLGAPSGVEKPLVAAGSSRKRGDGQLDHFLLDAVPDGEIKLELQALASLIEQHVENYYQLDSHADASSISKALWQLGFSESERDRIVVAMSTSSTTRHIGLQHVISTAVFKSIDFQSQSQISMLPPPISSFLQSMPEGNSSAGSNALSRWRCLSAYLLHPNSSDRSALEVRESDLEPRAVALRDHLNAFLRMFVAPGDAAAREQAKHLQAVITECTKFGYMILSQPRDWHFVFEVTGSDSLVTCPGLDKQAEGGQVFQRIVEPTTAPTRSRKSVRKAR